MSGTDATLVMIVSSGVLLAASPLAGLPSGIGIGMVDVSVAVADIAGVGGRFGGDGSGRREMRGGPVFKPLIASLTPFACEYMLATEASESIM